jgi:hypothetical protein
MNEVRVRANGQLSGILNLPLLSAYLTVGRAATIRLEKISSETDSQRRWVHTYGRISHLAILHGDIKVNADKYALVFEINVGDGEFVGERHG